MLSLSYVLLALTIVNFTSADGTDWVSPEYVLKQSSSPDKSTSAAQSSISHGALACTKAGPWTVTNTKVTAASRDRHDYLSWAPYHWPDCNWCPSSGRTHLAHTGDGTTNNTDSDDDPGSTFDSGPGEDVGDSDSGSFARRSHDAFHFRVRHNRMFRSRRALSSLDDTASSSAQSFSSHTVSAVSGSASALEDLPLPQAPLGGLPSQISVSPTLSHTTSEHMAGTATPAQAAVHTSNAKGSCTPSPTTSIAPSATWTTCPYKARDGQVNPDVRTLNGPGAINNVAQCVLYNALTYALQGTAACSQTAANFIKVFFLDASTSMNPNMNYGQVVRGPNGNPGTFTGMLDLRGMVKIVNAQLILEGAGSPHWTQEHEKGMKNWTSEYSNWLATSALGKTACSRPNNHATFCVAQRAALRIYLKDDAGAKALIDNFMANGFQNQIAKSGEQPFEAVRTRPFHYRCFNLEALIVLAKLGDQLGIDVWSRKSKYGATIQTAVDYLLTLDPGKEDITELVPHVAATWAAYGDPNRKYEKFLSKFRYQDKPFWFYDQKSALPNAPSSKSSKRSDLATGEEPRLEDFTCPEIFVLEPRTELDNGIFVTCDQVKPYFLIGYQQHYTST